MVEQIECRYAFERAVVIGYEQSAEVSSSMGEGGGIPHCRYYERNGGAQHRLRRGVLYALSAHKKPYAEHRRRQYHHQRTCRQSCESHAERCRERQSAHAVLMPPVEQEHRSGCQRRPHHAGTACRRLAVQAVRGEHDECGEHGARCCRASAHEQEDRRAHHNERQGGGQTRGELAHVPPRQRHECHTQMIERRTRREVVTRREGQDDVPVFQYRHCDHRLARFVHAEKLSLPEKGKQCRQACDNHCNEGNVFPGCLHNVCQFSFLRLYCLAACHVARLFLFF